MTWNRVNRVHRFGRLHPRWGRCWQLEHIAYGTAVVHNLFQWLYGHANICESCLFVLCNCKTYDRIYVVCRFSYKVFACFSLCLNCAIARTQLSSRLCQKSQHKLAIDIFPFHKWNNNGTNVYSDMSKTQWNMVYSIFYAEYKSTNHPKNYLPWMSWACHHYFTMKRACFLT